MRRSASSLASMDFAAAAVTTVLEIKSSRGNIVIVNLEFSQRQQKRSRCNRLIDHWRLIKRKSMSSREVRIQRVTQAYRQTFKRLKRMVLIESNLMMRRGRLGIGFVKE